MRCGIEEKIMPLEGKIKFLDEQML